MIRSALHFLTGTLISRFGGFARDVLMAFYFGTFAETAGFFVAYRMANIFRRIFAEGALLNGFVPYYEHLALESKEKGFFFFRDLSFSMFVFLIGFVGVIEGLIWALHFHVPENVQYILKLSSIMLPALIFICLFGLFNSYVQCKGRFFLSGVIPLSFNMFWIAGILFSRHFQIEKALTCISWTILASFILQWIVAALFAMPSLRSEGSFQSFLKPSFFSSSVKSMIRPFFASVVGVSAMQINSGLDVIFARIASLEGPAYLSYAIRIQQLPIAFFGVSIASALLPMLSKKLERGLYQEALSVVKETLRKVSTVLIFCTFGLFSLGFVGLNVVYARGGFNALSLHHTLRSLWMYGTGLIPASLIIILAPIFYAQKDFKTPMKSSLLAVGANLILNSLFVFTLHFDAEGIAFATSLSSWLNCSYLIFHLHQKNFKLLDLTLLKSLFKGTVAAVISFLIVQWIGYRYWGDTSWFSLTQQVDHVKILGSLYKQFFAFLSLSLMYSGFFLALGLIFRLFEYREVLYWIRRKTLPATEKIEN